MPGVYETWHFLQTVGVHLRLVVGGMSYTKQISGLERGVELLVATPGRLSDLVERRSCNLSEVEVMVLDEADHMAEMGFLPAITELLDMIPVGGQRLPPFVPGMMPASIHRRSVGAYSSSVPTRGSSSARRRNAITGESALSANASCGVSPTNSDAGLPHISAARPFT